jgi:hypothetical protein
LWPTVPDGLGIVMVATVSVLFKIFGVTLAVFPILAVGLSTVSVICLAARFPDSRLFVVPLHFLLLTTLLFSPVSTEATYIDDFSAAPTARSSAATPSSARATRRSTFDKIIGIYQGKM